MMATGAIALAAGILVACFAANLFVSFPDQPQTLALEEAAARAEAGKLTWLTAATPDINCFFRSYRQPKLWNWYNCSDS